MLADRSKPCASGRSSTSAMWRSCSRRTTAPADQHGCGSRASGLETDPDATGPGCRSAATVAPRMAGSRSPAGFARLDDRGTTCSAPPTPGPERAWTPDGSGRVEVTRRLVRERPEIAVAACLFVVLVATSGNYGWHRDEFTS